MNTVAYGTQEYYAWSCSLTTGELKLGLPGRAWQPAGVLWVGILGEGVMLDVVPDFFW